MKITIHTDSKNLGEDVEKAFNISECNAKDIFHFEYKIILNPYFALEVSDSKLKMLRGDTQTGLKTE